MGLIGCKLLVMPITLERTPIEKQIYAKSLLDNHTSIRTVARIVKLDPGTVNVIAWKQDYSPTLLEEFKRRLPFKAYKLADDVLDLIDPDEIKKAPLGVKMMAFGVAIDKARDMEGSNRPVFNIVTVVNEAQRTLSKLDAQLAILDGADRAQRPMLDGGNAI
jgi:hypothetical protein